MSMQLITGPRASGKTTELIKESAKTGIPIITPTMMMAYVVKQTARELGLDIPEPIGINKVIDRKGRPGRYYIDELELCLKQLGIDPVAVTICDNEMAYSQQEE